MGGDTMTQRVKRPFLSRCRGAWDVLAAGYDGATDSRYRTWQAYNRSTELDEDSLLGPYDRGKMQLEGRDMFRNHPVVRGAVNRLVDYAVAGGIWPQARTSDEAWNKEAEDWWRQVYVPTCDYRQHPGVDFTTFQGMNISERMLVGGLGYIMLANGQLQPIELARVKTPQLYAKDKMVVEGVRKTPGGLIAGYYVCDRNDSGAVGEKGHKYVKRENFIYCWQPTRPDMVKPVAELAPILRHLRDLDDTDNDIRGKIKLDAKHWAISKKEAGGAVNDRLRGAYSNTDASTTNPQKAEKVEGLRRINALPNEDLVPFESKTPNQHYVEYVEHQLRIVAQALGMPYEFLLMVFTAGSYSAQRAAMLHAHHAILQWVKWNNKLFNKRVWNWRVAKAIKRGDLPPAPSVKNSNGVEVSEWWKVEWSEPPWHQIDRDKEAKGEVAEYKMGKTSLKSIIATTGRDRDDVFAEKAEDIASAQKVAKDKLGDEGRWRDIIDVSTGQTVTQPAPSGGDDE